MFLNYCYFYSTISAGAEHLPVWDVSASPERHISLVATENMVTGFLPSTCRMTGSCPTRPRSCTRLIADRKRRKEGGWQWWGQSLCQSFSLIQLQEQGNYSNSPLFSPNNIFRQWTQPLHTTFIQLCLSLFKVNKEVHNGRSISKNNTHHNSTNFVDYT